ncbi:MAG: cupin-like domain-containing protein, partial [Chitinophagaceae bacterium]
MQVQPIDRVDRISPEEFQEKYFKPHKPVIITQLSHDWPAFTKWTWDYFIQLVGKEKVGLYNNNRADANTKVNGYDEEMYFGDYLEMVKKGPVELRIFLLNIFKHAPQLVEDITWPDNFIKGFLKKHPMLFVGGAGSIAHMNFDIELSLFLYSLFIGSISFLFLVN